MRDLWVLTSTRTKWIMAAYVGIVLGGYAIIHSPQSDQRALSNLEARATEITWRDAKELIPAGDGHDGDLDNLEFIARKVLGFKLDYVKEFEEKTGDYGETMIGSGVRQIVLEESLGPNARIAVLAHEMGHTLQPPFLDPGEAEVFAEAVAFLVCRRLNIDMFESAANYIALHRGGLRALQRYDDIEWATTVVSPR